MTLNLNRMSSYWNRDERIKINDNWDMIEQNFNGVTQEFDDVVREITQRFDNAVDEVTKKAYDEIIDAVRDLTKINWLEPVPTYDDIAATYPNPTLGDITITTDDGSVYRYDGEQWVFINKINPDVYMQLQDDVAAIQNGLEETNNNLMQLQQEFMSHSADTANKIGILNKKTEGIVSVKEFGAKGDGITDDTIAILDAIAYCRDNRKKLYFPNGTFLMKRISMQSPDVLACDMFGETIEGTKLILDGLINFDTSNLESVSVERMTFEINNNYASDVDLYNASNNAVFKSTTLKKVTCYKDLQFIANVPDESGKYRSLTCILDGATSNGVFDNITTKNIAMPINMLAGSSNYRISNMMFYNYQTGLWTKGSNYTVENINGINTFEQSLIWIQKNHPTTPRANNGLDLILCEGSRYTLENLNAVNPIERCVYSSNGSDVIANKLRCVNGDGFKFVGGGYDSITKNIKVSNTVFEITEDLVSAGKALNSEFTFYWVEDVIVENSVSYNRTKDPTLKSCVSIDRRVKNVKLTNMHADYVAHSFLYVIMRSEQGLPPSDYIVLDTLSMKNCSVKKDNRNSGSLLSCRTTEASNDAKSNYAMKNIKIEDCYIFYDTNTDDFWYDYAYTDGFFAKGNRANKKTVYSTGFHTYERDVTNNIVILEDRIITSNIGAFINNASSLKLTKGSKLEFIYDVDGMELKMSVLANNTLSSTDKQKVAPITSGSSLHLELLSNGKYFFVSPFISNYTIEITTKDGDYYRGKVVNNVKTDIIGTAPITINVGSGLEVRGDLYTKPFEMKVVGFL